MYRYRTFIGPSAVQKSSLVAWPEARALLAKGPAKVAAALSAVDVTRVPQINLVALWKYIAHEDWPAPAFAARPALSLLRAFVVARRTFSARTLSKEHFECRRCMPHTQLRALWHGDISLCA